MKTKSILINNDTLTKPCFQITLILIKTKNMTKKILIAFGLLDLFSFAVTSKFVVKIIENFEYFSLISIPEMLLIMSLVVSGVLSIMRKKISLIVYYFQFPLKITFVILTFGFLFKIFGFQYDSVGYKILLGVTTLLEITRLVITIKIHKKEFGK